MLLFRGAAYRLATPQGFARVLQDILDRHAKAFAKERSKDVLKTTRTRQLYERAKALAKDLNAAVHLEYETYVNLFGVTQFHDNYYFSDTPFVMYKNDRIYLEDATGEKLAQRIDATL